ncbi:coproporphyrinogen III oxidase [Bradyrhizobium jicamae]|uniref:Coproporphyrinogen-III oxidase n=1 Tax=Bradyrhizobium jicamae TaxID=280332 RepID=A0A0R3L3F1_9BRAD|nr:oxygen-independent coproporphyrinogen III oxidase [Bradyrhizobium jicamae]KRR02266.1 coproporphyrinogen III oxidase [Bradyrhizobium jicamae]
MRIELANHYGQERLPRYTSYPSAPHFSPAVDGKTYVDWLRAIPVSCAASLYLHVPFCRSMCWYCGCHTSVSKRDESIYAAAVRCEMQLLTNTLQHRLPLAHIHFGGGTPTVMMPEVFADLVGAMRSCFIVLPDVEIVVEVDPRTLTEPMTKTMAQCGVTRASLGVQSFDTLVQRSINRIQTFEQTAVAVCRLRQAGISGINFDLIYGLPHQSIDSCLETVEKCVELRPDRLAVFGYAHVPTFKKHQRRIAENTLPDSLERHSQSEAVSDALQCAGYVRIGLDHFALRSDPLAVAQREGRLHRNFQGYTDHQEKVTIGLGASAIGRLPQGFVQNAVATRDYLQCVATGHFATVKGCAISADDRFRAEIIERIMCDLAVDLSRVSHDHGRTVEEAIIDRERFERLLADGVITVEANRLLVAEDSRFLIRSVASTFDAHLAKGGGAHSGAV